MGIFNFTLNYDRLFELLECLALIARICKDAKYPEDLEDIYDILDKYIPDWKNKNWNWRTDTYYDN